MKQIPYEFAPDEAVEQVMDVFKLLFSDQVRLIRTQIVRKGGTSAVVNLPKDYQGKVVTMIVWERKEKFYEKGGIIKDADGKVLTPNIEPELPIETKEPRDEIVFGK